jgi:hypothetical protein
MYVLQPLAFRKPKATEEIRKDNEKFRSVKDCTGVKKKVCLFSRLQKMCRLQNEEFPKYFGLKMCISFTLSCRWDQSVFIFHFLKLLFFCQIKEWEWLRITQNDLPFKHYILPLEI